MKTRWSLVFGAVALLASPALAADHVGRVTLAGGVPVPGARVTATQGTSTLVTTTDTQGAYRFMGIAEGMWSFQVEMVGLAAQKRDVTVANGATGTATTEWHLSMLPFADITRGVPIPPPAPPPNVTRRAPATAGNNPSQPAGSFQRAGVAPGAPPANAAAA